MDRQIGKVQTVLGPVEPRDLALTLMHEHLLLDPVGSSSSPAATASDRAKWLEPLTLANYYDHRRNIHLYRDNLLFLSTEEAVREAEFFRAAGGGCIVEVTSMRLGRDPLGLARISRMSGVHVVMGGSYYVHEYHPPKIAAMTEGELRDEIAGDVIDGVPDPTLDAEMSGMVQEGMGWANPGIHSGIIGEIGLTWPVHPDERKVLRASAQAQGLSGAAITIHPGRNPQAPLDAVRTVEEAGGDLSRTVVDHLDRTVFDLEGLLELARTGCYLEFDLFGWQESFYPLAPVDLPSDGTRVNYLIALAEQGYLDRLLISHDIDVRVRRRQFGGEGIEHIPLRIVPLMRRKGMSKEEVEQIVIHNPAKVLTIV